MRGCAIAGAVGPEGALPEASRDRGEPNHRSKASIEYSLPARTPFWAHLERLGGIDADPKARSRGGVSAHGFLANTMIASDDVTAMRAELAPDCKITSGMAKPVGDDKSGLVGGGRDRAV